MNPESGVLDKKSLKITPKPTNATLTKTLKKKEDKDSSLKKGGADRRGVTDSDDR